MKRELVAQLDPKSPISEVFRTLRTNIQFMNTKGKLRSILVTSTLPGEGKSWTASNLAVTFAQAGKKVVIIDADMRKGRVYSIFGVSPKPGLSNYLSGVDWDEGEASNDVKMVDEFGESSSRPAGQIHVLCTFQEGDTRIFRNWPTPHLF